MHHQPPPIAILGANTVVGRALCALLEGSGYRTTPIDAYPTGSLTNCLRVRICCSSHPDWMRVYAKPS
jgi:hypothetical protein